jgi:hypothetical protein
MADTETVSMWQQLESPSADSTVVRKFEWPTQSIEYTITERVRNAVPSAESTYESIDSRSRQLRAQRGSGFEYAWRSSQDTLLSPSWLTLNSAAVDAESGRVVAAGHLTHEVWGLPPVYDYGGMSGRNALFEDEGHPMGLVWPAQSLYVGSIHTGAMAPLDSTVNVRSVDLFGATSLIATTEFLGSSAGAVSIYDAKGARRLLTVLGDDRGRAPIRFSGNGEWLLVTESGSQSTLVEVATGRWLRLDVGNAAWWPVEDSTLLTITHEDGKAIPMLYSLASNSYTRRLPEIVLDAPLLEKYPYVWYPAVSPDGHELLALTPAGVLQEYQSKNGVGNHLARVNLADGRGILASQAFFDAEQTKESDVDEVRWTARQPAREIHLHPDLEARLSSPVTQHEWLDPARWADEAERILVFSLNKAIALSDRDQDFSHLVPEILSALVPVSHDSNIWERQSGWLRGVKATASRDIVNGYITGSSATAWRRIGAAIAAIESGRPDLIDSVGAIWTSSLPVEPEFNLQRALAGVNDIMQRVAQGNMGPEQGAREAVLLMGQAMDHLIAHGQTEDLYWKSINPFMGWGLDFRMELLREGMQRGDYTEDKDTPQFRASEIVYSFCEKYEYLRPPGDPPAWVREQRGG